MDDFNTDRIEQAGDYNLEVCRLVSYRIHQANQKPVIVDIKPIIGSIELEENIYKHTMTGKIQVLDGNDIRTMLPLTGMEKLELKFGTPGAKYINFTEESGKMFYIYKIQKIKHLESSQRTQMYDIFFTSKEDYYNRMSKVSQAFSGTLEDGVEYILRSKEYLNSKKKFFFEPTKTNAKYVIPSLRPFDAINMLSKECISKKYNNAGYVFYETPDGFFFRSIESMFAMNGATERPAKYEYTFGLKNIRRSDGTRDVEADMKSAIQYEFDSPFDMLNNMKSGMFANKLIVHNAFDKTIKEYNFDYEKSYGDFYHTETNNGAKSGDKSMLPFAKFDDTDKDISQFPDGHTSVKTETSKVHNDYEFVPVNQTLPIRISQRNQLRNAILSLEVPGNSLLSAGDMIKFDVPLMKPVGEGEKQEPSPYYSGRYLVWAIRHVVSNTDGNYTCVLKCCKDAVNKGFPIETAKNLTDNSQPIVADIYEEDKNIMGTVT
tara:strand:+ start:7217 stop:8683 length:1467 start_codon:yes stop_codon:yes gene_type:complete